MTYIVDIHLVFGVEPATSKVYFSLIEGSTNAVLIMPPQISSHVR